MSTTVAGAIHRDAIEKRGTLRFWPAMPSWPRITASNTDQARFHANAVAARIQNELAARPAMLPVHSIIPPPRKTDSATIDTASTAICAISIPRLKPTNALATTCQVIAEPLRTGKKATDVVGCGYHDRAGHQTRDQFCWRAQQVGRCGGQRDRVGQSKPGDQDPHRKTNRRPPARVPWLTGMCRENQDPDRRRRHCRTHRLRFGSRRSRPRRSGAKPAARRWIRLAVGPRPRPMILHHSDFHPARPPLRYRETQCGSDAGSHEG